jgi:hypothetical protein
MADGLDSGQVKLRIIGTQAYNDRVLANVFAHKLSVLIRAAAAADLSANGAKRFDFVIIMLDANSPATALIGQQRATKQMPDSSSIDILGRCAESVNSGNFAFARHHFPCAIQLKKLANDVDEKFSHAELTVNGFKPITIDRYFLERATEAIAVKDEPTELKWFKGSAIGTFDGQILETDLRGDIPRVILRLTAGGKEIACVCPGLSVEDIRAVLNKRVNLTGSAFYDGKSGMPLRIEVSRTPEIIKASADFTKWKGAFEPFTPDEWGDEA